MIHKFFWRRDGASKYAWDLADALRERGHTVVPFSMRHGKNMHSPYEKYFVDPIELADTKVGLSAKLRAAGRIIYSLHAKRKLAQLLKHETFDVAHIHNAYRHISPSILGVLKRHGVKIVMTVHDYHLLSPNYSLYHHGAIHEEDARGWYWSCVRGNCVKNSRLASVLGQIELVVQHKVFNLYGRHVDMFIAPSHFLQALHIKYGWPASRFVHVRNPIDPAEFEKSTHAGKYVSYVGRLSEEKGLHVLLDAAGRLPEIPFQLVGAGPLEADLKRRVKKEQLQNVSFTGFLQGEELRNAMEASKLFVLPSVWYENGPLSVLEQMAREQIIVASRIGGLPEMLPSDLLAEPGDARDLARVITHWYKAVENKRKDMGKQLLKKAQTYHSHTAHVAKIEALYQDVVK